MDVSTGRFEQIYGEGPYLSEYYAAHTPENRDVGQFLAEASEHLKGQTEVRVLDAGCGPTILYWSLFVPAVTEIRGFDGDCGNIVAARRTVQEAKDGQFRTAFVEAAEHALSCHGCGESVVALLKSRAQAVGKLRVGDLARPWPYRNGAFDHVISCFALECLRDWTEFDFALCEAFRVLRTNAAFVLVNVAETTNWNCGGIAVPILCVREADLRQRLEAAGFANAATRQGAALDLSLRDQGYAHVLFSRGVKPSVD